MKWFELYNGLTICDQTKQPDCTITNHFARMAKGEIFALSPHYSMHDEDGGVLSVLCADQTISAVVLQARAKKTTNNVVLTFKTVGVLPPGIIHGIYILEFDDGDLCDKLPIEMFKDEEVPEGELSHWHTEEEDDEEDDIVPDGDIPY